MKKLQEGIRCQDNKLPIHPFEYSKFKCYDGKILWLICTPNGYLCGIEKHKIEEHGNGTITVSPSILLKVRKGKKEWDELWHGYIKKGIWYEV